MEKKEKIFEENKIKDIIKDIIGTIKMSILMPGNLCYSKYIYNTSKKTWKNLNNYILRFNYIR